MKKYSFVYMLDERFYIPTVVSICSLLYNKSVESEYDIHIILDGVCDTRINMLKSFEKGDIKIFPHCVEGGFCEELSKKIDNADIKVSRTDMLKFELPNYLRDLDCVLYLDGDLLINNNIEELFDIKLNGYYIAAVNDMGDTIDEKGVSRNASRIGLPGNDYFNAGMMLMNLYEMRKDNISEKLWDYRKTKTNYFMSQDALNFVTYGKRIVLSNKYNFITAVFDDYSMDEINNKFVDKKYTTIEECIDDQRIIHMAGKMKPWIYYMPWITERFFRFYSESFLAKEMIVLESPIYKKNREHEMAIYENMWNAFCCNVSYGESIILYGAGKRGIYIYKRNIEEKYCNISLWIDSNANNIGLNEVAVYTLDCISKKQTDRIIISVSNREAVRQIKKNLLDTGINSNLIVAV